jgi:hypothetical protein
LRRNEGRSYLGLKWIRRHTTTSPAKVLKLFLRAVALFHSLQLREQIEAGTKLIVLLKVQVLSLRRPFPHIEHLLAPTTDLVDERGIGLGILQLFDEPLDVVAFEMPFHDALEEEWMCGCLSKSENPDQPGLLLPFLEFATISCKFVRYLSSKLALNAPTPSL